MRLKIILFSLVSMFVSCGYSGHEDLDKKINNLLDHYHIPGASIAVVEQSDLLWAQGYGYADLENKRPVELDTLFQAASITKALTSAAVLQILKKYDIALDAPVNAYLKRWKIPENQFTKNHPVTLRMLLNHTAAISNPYPDGGYAFNADLPSLLQVFLGQAPATNPPLEVMAVPGEAYQYCNGCYAILQLFLEDVTGIEYSPWMEKQILKPLKMKNSQFNNQLFLSNPERFALPYGEHQQRFPQAPITLPVYATGLLLTTASDLAKFVIAIQQSLNTQQGFFSQALAQDLVKPSSTLTRGLGFFIGDKEGKETPDGKYFMHSGSNVGYLTLLIGSMDGKHAAVLMINISPKWDAKKYPQFAFINEVLGLIAQKYDWK